MCLEGIGTAAASLSTKRRQMPRCLRHLAFECAPLMLSIILLGALLAASFSRGIQDHSSARMVESHP
jgi:hypothetical protein